MWQWFVDTLRLYPEIAIFLTLGLGFWLGKFKIGSFSLGVVTSVLLAGVLVGQLEISISPHVKSTFFLMFLFAVGYGVGPQFFRGLKGDGIQQVLFAVVQCVAVLATAVIVGKALGYDAGGTAGLLSGSSTISAVLGVATTSIGQLGIGDAEKQAMLNAMPVAYAVTYLFGTAGSAWILATPRAEDSAGGYCRGVPPLRGRNGRRAVGECRPDVRLHRVRAARLPADRSRLGGQDRARIRSRLQ